MLRSLLRAQLPHLRPPPRLFGLPRPKGMRRSQETGRPSFEPSTGSLSRGSAARVILRHRAGERRLGTVTLVKPSPSPHVRRCDSALFTTVGSTLTVSAMQAIWRIAPSRKARTATDGATVRRARSLGGPSTSHVATRMVGQAPLPWPVLRMIPAYSSSLRSVDGCGAS